MSESPPYTFRPFALRAAFFCALVYVVSLAAGCDGCGEPPIATLVEARGPDVQRDYANRMRQWEKAENGARFAVGDAIRTGANATARMTLIDQSQLELAPKTTLRFLIDGAQAGEDALNVESGQVSLRVGLEELLLRTHIGLAKLLAGTEVTLRRRGENLEYEVALGEAQFQNSSGTIRRLGPGDSVEVGIGMAFLNKATPDPEPEPKHESEPEVAPGAIMAAVQTAGVRRRTGNGAWSKLPKGSHTLEPGTQIRLTARDKVDLTRDEERAALSGAGEYVVGIEGGLIQARKGDLTVTAEQRDVAVLVPGGTIVLRAVEGGSQAKVSIGEATGRVAVQRGAATVDLLGVVNELSAGNERRWTHTDEEGDSSAPILPSLGYQNLAARAGESFAVHAPEVPAAVGFNFPGKCPHEGVIELVGAKLRARGKERVSLAVPPGAHAYTLRCIDDKGTLGRVIARANVQVLHDAGTRKLPPKAPTSLVETDGRTYTIYYQNQLPDVNVSWPNAPKSQSYELILDGKSMRLSKPEHTFRSGSVRDGTHEVSFQAGDRRSRTTSIEVRFDNAAPKASLSSPPDRGFKAGDKVTIEGVALETWKVSVEGGSITMDAARRFSGDVATSAEHPDIAVRLSHPRLGVHYYLRRAAGSP